MTEKIAQTVSATTVTSVVSTATQVVETAIPTTTGVAVAFLRKLIYRAAGDEGLAENIPVPGSPIPVHQQQHVIAAGEPTHNNPVQNLLKHITREKIVYRTEYQSVPCIDTSGEAFAVYLNLIYLAPLTILFMRFFFKSYLRRGPPGAKGKPQPKRRTISDAAGDAKRSVEREFDALDKSAEDGISSAVNQVRDTLRGRKTNANGSIKDDRHGSLSPANKKFLDSVNRKVKDKLQEIDEGAEATGQKAKQGAKDVLSKANEAKGRVADSWQDVKKEANKEAENGSQKIKQEADKVMENAQQASNNNSPSKKSPKKLRKAENKAKRESEAQSQNLDDSAVAKPESEPEPKDLKNTLSKGEGKDQI